MKAIAAITAMAIRVPESRTRAGECLRGLRSRMERSTRAQEIQAQSEIIEPMARARIENCFAGINGHVQGECIERNSAGNKRQTSSDPSEKGSLVCECKSWVGFTPVSVNELRPLGSLRRIVCRYFIRGHADTLATADF